MQLELLNDQGQSASKLDVPETVFGREYNEDLVHQIVVAYQANARQGTRAQKDREQVRHSTKKPFKQKGTGNARAGMTSSPLWLGGGRISRTCLTKTSRRRSTRRCTAARTTAHAADHARPTGGWPRSASAFLRR